MQFLFPYHFNTIRTNKQTNTQQSSCNNIDKLRILFNSITCITENEAEINIIKKNYVRYLLNI